MNTEELIDLAVECGALLVDEGSEYVPLIGDIIFPSESDLTSFTQRIEQRQWQPIETCPKCKAVDVMCRSNLGNTEDFVRVTNATQLDSGRWLGLSYWHVPTHWMPIPALLEETK